MSQTEVPHRGQVEVLILHPQSGAEQPSWWEVAMVSFSWPGLKITPTPVTFLVTSSAQPPTTAGSQHHSDLNPT